MGTEVIIVGAGPVGLMLAGELRLGGVDVVVYEQRTTPSGESRGLGFTARATEVLEQRGLLARFENAESSRQGHFGGIPMDFGILEGCHFGVRGVPQYRVERMLEDWARELGAQVRRDHELVGLRATPTGVVAVVDGPGGRSEHAASYLVGCDGGRSTVRQLAGFEFPGTDATREMYLADVVGRGIRPRFIGERVPSGMVMAAPLEDGVDRIIVCPNGMPPSDSDRSVTFAEIADAWQQLTGESLHGAEARWVSTFTDATRQATEYRRGRVLLAGDAAHIHLPAGGQGMSVGIQDAVNLGWKLAATIHGWAPAGLLDTYHTERHPVGARVLRNTLAQGTLYLSGSEVEPLRAVMTELIAIPEAARHLAGMVSGLDIRYDVGVSGHPLLGMRMPNHELVLPNGDRTRVADLLHAAHGVLVSTDGATEARRLAADWADRVDLATGSWAPTDSGLPRPDSVLIRPDGYVAWAGSGQAPEQAGELGDALRRWFGSSRPPSPPPPPLTPQPASATA
jgi:2-polyprenyl-6-methoxyphenol hydroxylase-like FAD-dependent oxidoreductase